MTDTKITSEHPSSHGPEQYNSTYYQTAPPVIHLADLSQDWDEEFDLTRDTEVVSGPASPGATPYVNYVREDIYVVAAAAMDAELGWQYVEATLDVRAPGWDEESRDGEAASAAIEQLARGTFKSPAQRRIEKANTEARRLISTRLRSYGFSSTAAAVEASKEDGPLSAAVEELRELLVLKYETEEKTK